jgi:hypothetical protein
MRRRYFTPSMAVALVALVTAASGGAYAAARISSPQISACARHSGGGLDVARRCVHGDSRLTWNAIGPQGPAGPIGPQGAAGPAGAIGPSDAFAGHKDGPVDLTVDATGHGRFTTIASLPIPRAGSYVLFAKADLSNSLVNSTGSICELTAGDVGSGGSFDTSGTDTGRAIIGASSHVGMSLNVVHQYNGAGTAEVRCESSEGTSSAANIKITAIRLGSVTDATLP